uniref:RF_PROK_I domain-containing protein n=1 Tax=Rhabditophanes sp. KR3021 TaxID=114890 RepID=A0AC35UC78_9BILA
MLKCGLLTLRSSVTYLTRSSSAYSSIFTKPETDAFLKSVKETFLQIKSGECANEHDASDISYYEGVVDKYGDYSSKLNDITQLKLMIQQNEDDQEMKEIGESELKDLTEGLNEVMNALALSIVRMSEVDCLKNCQIEFSCGAGGSEAMMFTMELYQMYEKYCQFKGFTWTPIQFDDVSSTSLRAAVVLVSGEMSFSRLRFEAGVHRVQRIPLTDKSRMHTSTASLSVLPEPENPEIIIKSSDCKVEAMRASGPGGQNVNKRSSAVRVTHLPTKIAVHVMDERFQHLNLQIAYKRLAGILMQGKLDAVLDQSTRARKLQVGSKGRAEKVRTFNFQNGRITDHRLRQTVGNLEGFMEGNEGLDQFTTSLNELYILERLEDTISSYLEKTKKP